MDNIILIGMPGCGKSTVGVLLAKRLGYRYTDVDLLIQETAGKRLFEILRDDGEAYFTALENRVGASIDATRTVIATGGLAGMVAPLCRRNLILDDDLLLKGLMLIYQKNSGK